jgi:hypothetical protein
MLIHDGKRVELRGVFQNLPLVIAQRDRIRPEFKEYCANLSYDLSVYKRFFDEQDRVLGGEPLEVAESAREALLRTEGRGFLAFLHAQVSELEDRSPVRNEEHERQGSTCGATFGPISRRANA